MNPIEIRCVTSIFTWVFFCFHHSPPPQLTRSISPHYSLHVCGMDAKSIQIYVSKRLPWLEKPSKLSFLLSSLSNCLHNLVDASIPKLIFASIYRLANLHIHFLEISRPPPSSSKVLQMSHRVTMKLDTFKQTIP